MWPSTILVCAAILLGIASYGYCSVSSLATVVVMAGFLTLYAYGILLLIYERRHTLSLVNSTLLMAIAVFDTKVLKLALKRSQGGLWWFLNA